MLGLQSERLYSRILLPAICLSALLLTMGVVAAGSLMRSQRDATKLLGLEIDSIRHSEELASTIRVAEVLALRGGAAQDAQATRLRDLETASARSLNSLEGLLSSQKEKDLFPSLQAAHSEFWSALRRIVSGSPEEPALIDAAAERVLQQIANYSNVDQNLARDSSLQQRTLFDRLALFFAILGLAGSFFSMAVGFVVARSLQRSMVELSVSIQDTAGKLDEVVGPIKITRNRAAASVETLVSDISSRLELITQRLAQSHREVLRAEQLASLGRLAAGLAHELRNPIASMKLLIQSALERGTAIGDRRLIVLEEEILRLESQIQVFLDFARPPVAEKRRFDLDATIDQQLLLVSGRAQQKRLRIERDRAAQNVCVVADPGQIRQLVLNFLLNAIDASPDGGTIFVRAAYEQMDTNLTPHVVIEVGDSGPGMPDDVIPRLFEPFFTTKQSGIGLGLPICKQIVEAHQGTIEACNRADRGALFRVVLPIAADHGGAPAPVASALTR